MARLSVKPKSSKKWMEEYVPTSNSLVVKTLLWKVRDRRCICWCGQLHIKLYSRDEHDSFSIHQCDMNKNATGTTAPTRLRNKRELQRDYRPQSDRACAHSRPSRRMRHYRSWGTKRFPSRHYKENKPNWNTSGWEHLRIEKSESNQQIQRVRSINHIDTSSSGQLTQGQIDQLEESQQSTIS